MKFMNIYQILNIIYIYISVVEVICAWKHVDDNLEKEKLHGISFSQFYY